MFLTKKHLSRRTTLKGLGISMGLPLLDAMIPAATALAATAAVPKPRVGFFYIPHGMIMDNTPYGKEVDAWTPTRLGRELHAEQDHEADGEVQAVPHLGREPREHGERGFRAHAESGHLAVGACVPMAASPARTCRRRSTR